MNGKGLGSWDQCLDFFIFFSLGVGVGFLNIFDLKNMIETN
jgi:hypothetical protein